MQEMKSNMIVFTSPRCLWLQCEVPNYTALDIIINFQLFVFVFVLLKVMNMLLVECIFSILYESPSRDGPSRETERSCLVIQDDDISQHSLCSVKRNRLGHLFSNKTMHTCIVVIPRSRPIKMRPSMRLAMRGSSTYEN